MFNEMMAKKMESFEIVETFEENEIDENGLLCHKENCNRNLYELHKIGNGSTYCQECQERLYKKEWIEAGADIVEEIAEANGWEIADRHTAQTNTVYIELQKIDEDGEIVKETKIRISDHGSAYCSEEFSIALNPSGDDHDPDYVLEFLKK